MKKKLFTIAGALLLMAFIGGGIYLNSLLPIITGYAAKNLASAVFVSGRQAAEVEALDLNFSLIRYVSNTVDDEHKTVTSRFLWGESTAAYREGYGVTLLRGVNASTWQQQAFPLPPDTAATKPLPRGDSAFSARLEPIAKAFVDDRTYGGHPFAFMVLHNGGVVSERYDKGIGPDTKLLCWSVTKSFVNALVGIMVKDAEVSMDFYMNKLGFELVGGFETDRTKFGEMLGNIEIRDEAELEDFCKANHVDAAFLCIPRQSVEQTLERLYKLGIKCFWNFSHFDISAKYSDAVVENVHLSDNLMTLCYRMTNRESE